MGQLKFKSCGKERLPTLVNSSSQALDRASPESDPQKPFTLARMIRAVGSDNQQVFRNTKISVQDCVNAFTMKSCHRSCRTAPECCTRRKRLIPAVRSARPGGMPNIARFTAGLQLESSKSPSPQISRLCYWGLA